MTTSVCIKRCGSYSDVYLALTSSPFVLLDQSFHYRALSHAFVDMQDIVTGGAGMLHIFASIYTERDETTRPAPGVEYQNKVSKVLCHVQINVYTVNWFQLLQFISQFIKVVTEFYSTLIVVCIVVYHACVLVTKKWGNSGKICLTRNECQEA